MLETSLWSFLDSELGCSVYPVHLPQSPDYPTVTYSQVSGPRGYTHDGPDGLVTARYQISCWSPSYSDAKSTANDVMDAVSGYSGNMEGTHVGLITVDNESDAYENESGVFFIAIDIMIHYRENSEEEEE